MKQKKLLRMILFGVILKPRKETRLFIESLVNPGPDYVISSEDRAYLLVLEKGEFVNIT
jgi:hypothetical protein